MKKLVWVCYTLFVSSLVVLLCVSCEIKNLPLATASLDLDATVLHRHPVQYGFIFSNRGCGSRDALSDNLIFNANLSLGNSVPLLCVYHPTTQELSTPNGFRLPYPPQGTCVGWLAEEGRISLQEQPILRRDSIQKSLTKEYYLLAQGNPQDSIPHIRIRSNQMNSFFSLAENNELFFEMKAKCTQLRDSLPTCVTAYITGLNEEKPCSNVLRFDLQSDTFTPLEGVFKIVETKDSACLVIESNRDLAMKDFYLSANKPEESTTLSQELIDKLKQLNLSFNSFPNEDLADGYYENTYYSWQKGDEEKRKNKLNVWTLSGTEYTGQFGLETYLKVRDELTSTSHYIMNAGITSMKAAPRHENILELPKRMLYLKEIAKHMMKDTTNEDSAQKATQKIVFGAGMEGSEYTRRYVAVDGSYPADSTRIELLPGGLLDTWPTPDFSYAFMSWEGADFTEFISGMPPLRDSLRYMRQARIYGEMEFESTLSQEQQKWPMLVDRAVAVIEAEKRGELIRGLSFSPLFADAGRWDYLPLFYLRGGKAESSILYSFLESLTNRKKQTSIYSTQIVESQSSFENDSKIKDLYMSCSTSPTQNICYLLATNTTRHTLNIKFKLKHKGKNYRNVSYTHFYHLNNSALPKTKEFEAYKKLEGEREKLNGDELQYTFSPFEVVLFKFTK